MVASPPEIGGRLEPTSPRRDPPLAAAARRERPVSLDLVVPVFNEEEAIPVLLARLGEVFSAEARQRHGLRSVRYIFVDDGSRDRTAAILAREIGAGLPALLCRLSRNFGHQSAVSAGLDLADADLVAVIDADLQDPPELLPQMVARWREGTDVVFAQRRKRRDNPLKVAGAWAFYRLVALMADLDIPLDTGDFCLMDARVVRAMKQLPEKLRFPRGLRAWVGFRQSGIEYDRPVRAAGRSKYGWRRLYKLATDGVVSSSVRPLQLAQVFSVTYLLLTLVGLVILLRPGTSAIPAWVVGGYLLIVFGNFVQVLCIYILGAYVGRTYLEVKGRPTYVVRELVHARDAGGGAA
jgi:dolichol-phosphate mannosyltransferase